MLTEGETKPRPEKGAPGPRGIPGMEGRRGREGANGNNGPVSVNVFHA